MPESAAAVSTTSETNDDARAGWHEQLMKARAAPFPWSCCDPGVPDPDEVLRWVAALQTPEALATALLAINDELTRQNEQRRASEERAERLETEVSLLIHEVDRLRSLLYSLLEVTSSAARAIGAGLDPLKAA